ncbi:MAG: biopolymer transporter ExbD [Planctomycetota bacterium]|nr:biopolymer transporter ExbD [Planctomycetota bacterium]
MILLQHQKTNAAPESDMTPMVDVAFLLLIFFVVTASFTMQRSLVVPKPTGPEPDLIADADIVVEVDEFNTFHVTADDWEQEAPSEHDLIRALRHIREQEGSNKALNRMLVKANPDALYEKVVAALDSGAYVGISDIALLTLDID